MHNGLIHFQRPWRHDLPWLCRGAGLALWLATGAAQAGTTTCPMNMVEPDCTFARDIWSPSSSPTFVTYCTGSSLTPPDAAPTPSSHVQVNVAAFSLRVDDVPIAGGRFTATGTTCPVYWQAGSVAPGQVFRYTGPLVPGRRHVIVNRQHTYSSSGALGSFDVGPATEPTPGADTTTDGAPAFDTAPAQVAPDAAPRPNPEATGDGCVVGPRSHGAPGWLLIFLLWLAVLERRSKGRPVFGKRNTRGQ